MSQLFQNNNVIDIDSVKTKYTKSDGTIDTDALLKKAAHADVHISNLEREQAGLREELKIRESLEKVMEEIKSLKPQSIETPVISQSQHQGTTESGKLTAQEIENMIATRLKNEREQSTKARNVALIEQELQKVWGPAWKAELQRKAQAEGLNTDRLADLAETEPAMFLKVINPQSLNLDVAPPTSRLMSSVDKTGQVKNYKYFDDIRKKSPSTYWSQAVQDDLIVQAALQGESFNK